MAIKKGDVVRIVLKDSILFGKQGEVIEIDECNRNPDSDGSILVLFGVEIFNPGIQKYAIWFDDCDVEIVEKK